MIPRDRERQLRTYYASSIFERSATGPALERAEREGLGRYQDEERKHGDRTRLRAERRAAERSARKTGDRLPPRPTDQIGASTDYLPITARPTITSRQSEAAVEPDLGAIEIAATVSRWIAAIQQRGHPQTPAVLRAFYGSEGRAFVEVGLPELGAVYPLTSPGQKLLVSAARLYASGKGADRFAELGPHYRTLVLCALRAQTQGVSLPGFAVHLAPLLAPEWPAQARRRIGQLAELFPAADRAARAMLERAGEDLAAVTGPAAFEKRRRPPD